jgi:tetratricopeptide (TPR) repeat protein
MLGDTLKLILDYRVRRPTPGLPRKLDHLFGRLAVSGLVEAERIQDDIWRVWMSHRSAAVEQMLRDATDAIVQRRLSDAEEILDRLVAAHPDFPEAWNKRATLYYMQNRDAECLRDLHRVLALEPRHFGAMCSFAQIGIDLGEPDLAIYAFDIALRINPHLDEARATARWLLATSPQTLQ